MLYPIHQPLRFAPYFRSMPWGGRKIERYLGKNLPTPEPYGESWEVSDHPLHQSRLATASGSGVTLRQLMTANRADLLGSAADRHTVFPWLIKLLDAEGWLSVQVHPDPDAVKKLLPGEGSKTEAWHVLDADPGSRIYAGLKPGVGPQEFRTALGQGRVVDCLHSFTPKAGDFVYLPAGTVHAVGGGVFFAEIQETSDATFRLFDWHRRDRQLHLDEGLASIDWAQGPIEPSVAVGDRLVACRYFQVDRIGGPGPCTLGGVHQLQALIVTAGQGRFDNGEFVMAGDVWILPAVLPKTTLRMEKALAGLLCTLPE
jgi:mannose-6-phosphate isomerase